MKTWLAQMAVVVLLVTGVALASPQQKPDSEPVPVGIKRVGFRSEVIPEWNTITLRAAKPRGDRQQLLADIDGRVVLIEALTVRNHPEGLTPFRLDPKRGE